MLEIIIINRLFFAGVSIVLESIQAPLQKHVASPDLVFSRNCPSYYVLRNTFMKAWQYRGSL